MKPMQIKLSPESEARMKEWDERTTNSLIKADQLRKVNFMDLKKMQGIMSKNMNGIKVIIETTAEQVDAIKEDLSLPDRAKPERIRKLLDMAIAQKDAKISEIRENVKQLRQASANRAALIDPYNSPGMILAAEQDVKARTPEQLQSLYEQHADNPKMRHHIARLAKPILEADDVPQKIRLNFDKAVRKHRSPEEIERDSAHASADSLEYSSKVLSAAYDRYIEEAWSGRAALDAGGPIGESLDAIHNEILEHASSEAAAAEAVDVFDSSAGRA